MKVNLHKHTCRGTDCGATASVLASDGFAAYFLCASCSRRGITARHIRRHHGTIIPAAESTCGGACAAL